ncbi:MAG: glycosyltransferase family 39 protein [Phycisphaeraceae bacterium]
MSTDAPQHVTTAAIVPEGAGSESTRAERSPAPGAARAAPRTIAVFILGLALATALGAGLRLYQLDAHSFWADELYTLSALASDAPASPPWRGWSHWSSALSLRLSGADLASAHPDEPWAWRSLGLTERAARLGPAVLGIVAIPLLAVLALPMLGRRGALLLALLIAAAPWHVYWSQNARFYMPLSIAVAAFLTLYYHGTRRGSQWHIVAAIVCFVIAYLHHAPAIFLAAVLPADWLIARWMGRPLRLERVGWIAAVASVGLCALLLALDMTLLSASWEHLAEQPRGHGPAMLLAGTAYMGQATLMVLAGLTAYALIRRGERLGWYLSLAAAAPLGALFYLTATDQTFVHTRYGFFAYFAYLALAAAGLTRIEARLRPRCGPVLACAPAAVVVVALLQMSYFYHSGGQGFRSMWGQAFAWVDAQADPEAGHVAGEAGHVAGAPVMTNFTLAGFYYLEDDPRRVKGFPDSPAQLEARAAAAMDETGAPGVWLVTAVETAQGRAAEAWIDREAELKAYFDTRIEQPHSSVRVYWYAPDGQ